MRQLYFLTTLFCTICTAQALADLPYRLPTEAAIRTIRSADILIKGETVRFELLPEIAPRHVANFKYLADKGFYNNTTFHLVYPQLIIQAGAPDPSQPNSGPGYSLEPEFSNRHHVRGVLGMARLPNEANAERASHGSQFHILLAPNSRMDGQYTIFGECSCNCDLLDTIKKGDHISSVKVYIRK